METVISSPTREREDAGAGGRFQSESVASLARNMQSMTKADLGRFAVTAELNPPDRADPHSVYARALVLASVCDAINATDASGANVHMSSVAVCALLTQAGYSPVLQVSSGFI